MDQKDKETKIAVFKYGIIAPVLNDKSMQQKKYFRRMAEKEYDVPYMGNRKFSASTFKKWLLKYNKDGFDGLKPSFRKDKGYSRSISEQLRNLLSDVVKKFRFRTVKNVYDYLIVRGIIQENQFTYATLNNYIRKNDLFKPEIQQKPRKAFETEHINQLWMTDFMYGPYVKEGKKKFRSYLVAILDDHSRLIVSADFFLTQSLISFEQVLKDAFLKFGICNKLYMDNGKVFYDNHLKLISARLGFILVHSRPYEAASRGKIERWFRTLRDTFIPNLYIERKEFSLKQLNESFHKWLQDKYNRKIHSTIKTTPFDRYFNDMNNVKIRKKSTQVIQQAFLHTTERIVNRDSTISFEAELFEVDPKYTGQRIEIRFDPMRKDELYLFENDRKVCQLKKLDRQANSKFPVKFNTEDK